MSGVVCERFGGAGVRGEGCGRGGFEIDSGEMRRVSYLAYDGYFLSCRPGEGEKCMPLTASQPGPDLRRQL